MTRVILLSAVAAIALASGCGKDSPTAVAPAEPTADDLVAEAKPLQFRIDGMRRVNGAL